MKFYNIDGGFIHMNNTLDLVVFFNCCNKESNSMADLSIQQLMICRLSSTLYCLNIDAWRYNGKPF
jgi:hypothetical protein